MQFVTSMDACPFEVGTGFCVPVDEFIMSMQIALEILLPKYIILSHNSVLGSYCKVKVFACSGEFVHDVFHHRLRACVVPPVISKEKFFRMFS